MATVRGSRVPIAIVGLGRWGRRLLRAFHDQTNVVFACSRADLAKAKWLEKSYPEIVHTFDYGQVIANPEIEAVVIGTPIATHSSLAEKALRAGKHVFVEKPLAAGVGEAIEVANAAEGARKVLFVGFVFLYHPAFLRLQELLANDPAVEIKCSWRKYGTFQEGIVANLASHEIAIAQALFGHPAQEATVQDCQPVVTQCDILDAQLLFGNGRSCTISIDRCSRSISKTVTISTESGRVYVWDSDHLWERSSGNNELRLSQEEPLAQEVAAFLDSIETGRQPLTDGAFGVEVTRTMNRMVPRSGSRNVS